MAKKKIIEEAVKAPINEATIPDYPISREEQYLNKIAGTAEATIPDYPISRREQYLNYIALHGGGGGGGMVNPMTAANDIIIGGAAGSPTRLAVGSAGQVLRCGTTGLTWSDNYDAKFSYHSATDTLTVNSGLDVATSGDVTVGRDLYIEDEIVIDGGNKLVDTDGHAIGLPYYNEAPTAANTAGDLKVVVLSSEPATKYAGWLYLIEEA